MHAMLLSSFAKIGTSTITDTMMPFPLSALLWGSVTVRVQIVLDGPQKHVNASLHHRVGLQRCEPDAMSLSPLALPHENECEPRVAASEDLVL